MASLPERYSDLVAWVEEAGGQLHPSVEIAQIGDMKGSFRAKDAIKFGENIVVLPLSRTLSYLNAINNHPEYGKFSHGCFPRPDNTTPFPKEFLETVPPHVIGRFVLMQQYLLGNQSEWWPYIRALPQPEHISGMLPALWPEDDIEFLQGTNAYVAVQEIKSTLKKEYKDAIKLLPADFRSTYTRPLYMWSYGIFTSRSFRPSLVIPDADSIDLPCAVDDFSLLLPLYDLGNHSPTAKATWDMDRERQTVSLQICQDYQPGQQVFNNYGNKTNAELLLGYGFMLPEADDFHNDYVHIKTKPTDDDDFSGTHLVSLRPMRDPSSVVGRSRRLASADVQVAPEYAHIQDSLVASLYEAIMKGIGADEDDDIPKISMDDLMAGDFAPALRGKIVQALGSKLSYDLDVLDSVEVPREDLSANQEIAVVYRDQCARVFENALRSLMVGMESEEVEEDGEEQ